MNEPFDDRDGTLWVNGQAVPWREAKLHVLTHSLHYGGAVFEGERAYGGKIFESRKHSERLHRSASLMGYEIPYAVAVLEEAKELVIRENSLSDAYVRVIAWRGSESMGVTATTCTVHVAVTAYPWGTYYGEARKRGARLGIAKWRRPAPETAPFNAKTSGLYMISTLAKHDAEAQGYADAMMLDYRGYVAESTGANMFFVRDGEVHTPIADCFLDGITRRTAIRLLEARNVPVQERHIQPEELDSFEQCFLSGTAAEITPVTEIGEHKFEIGTIVRTLSEDYDSLVCGNR